MRRLLWILFACGLLWAQPPIPRYEVKRAQGRIEVDGQLDDKAWEAAGVIELFFPWESQTGPKQKTRVRLLWDDQNLYVGYDCEDTDITAQYTQRDDPTYQDDTVEIFINPRPSQTGIYFGLEMNARGTLYDYLMYDAKYAFKQFDLKGVKLATYLRGTLNARGDTDQGWSLEVSIPWSNFSDLAEKPVAGTVWRANMARWDGVGRDRALSLWSHSLLPRPHPHAPERFGELVFVQ